MKQAYEPQPMIASRVANDKPPEKQPEIQNRLQTLEQAVGRLHELWEQHCNRLESVIRMEPATSEQNVKEASLETPLGERLRLAAQAIQALGDSVQDVTRRVEL